MESDDTPEAIKLRKVTGLALMLHDFGESLGEPGTLEQESKNASFQKDKPAAERLIMEGILYHAAAAVESGNYTKFYNRLDEMKIPDTSGKAQVESNEEFLAHVKERLGELPAISAESEARVDLFRQFWDLQEKAGNVPESLEGQINSEFIRNLCGLSEHMQGEGYFLAMLQRDDSPENASGPASWSRVRSKYQLSNLKYNEGEVGNLFAHASTPLEKAVALEAKKEAYAKSIEFLELGSAAVDRFATPDSELSPKDPNRTAEIEALVEKSEAQGAELAAQGKGHEVRPIETRERLVAMYKWALENDDFIPGPGQILVLNPPAEYRFDEPKKGFAGKVAAERAAPKETGLSA